jgi:hypothetical protein
VTKHGERNSMPRKQSIIAVRNSNALQVNIDRRKRGGNSKRNIGIRNNADETMKPAGARTDGSLQTKRSRYLDDRAMFQRAVDHFLRGQGKGGIGKYVYPSGQCEESSRD